MDGSTLVRKKPLEEVLVDMMQEGVSFDCLRLGVQAWVLEHGQLPCHTVAEYRQVKVTYFADMVSMETVRVTVDMLPEYKAHILPAGGW